MGFFPYLARTIFISLSASPPRPGRTVAAAFDWISWYTTTVLEFGNLEDSVRTVTFLKVWFLFHIQYPVLTLCHNKNFPVCLQKYENYLLSIRSFSSRDSLLKRLIGVKTTFGINQSFKVERLENWTPGWSSVDAHLICSLICGYRLLDVMAFVHGCNAPAVAVPRTLLQDNEQLFQVS